MSWSWQYVDHSGTVIETPVEPCVTSVFPTQSDAEAFVSDTCGNCARPELVASRFLTAIEWSTAP